MTCCWPTTRSSPPPALPAVLRETYRTQIQVYTICRHASPTKEEKSKSHFADPIDIMLSLFSLFRSLICPSMSPATPSSRLRLSAWDIDCFCWGEAAREERERERRSSSPPPSTSSTSWEKMRTLRKVRFFFCWCYNIPGRQMESPARPPRPSSMLFEPPRASSSLKFQRHKVKNFE